MRKGITKAAIAMISAVLTALGLSRGTISHPKVYGPPPMEYEDTIGSNSENIQETNDSTKAESENEKGNN